MNFKIFSILFLLLTSIINAQQLDPLEKMDNYGQRTWVDSIINSMTIDQKIGQLFMVQAYSNKDEKHKDFIDNLINKYEVGGLIFMQGTPEKQAVLNNHYQDISKVPLLIGFDGEWGLDMRLKNTYRFPWNMTLGAIQDDQLIEQFGEQLGKHCKRLGIHINFAPVVDININPQNPIIGNRSFGESRENVANKSLAFTKGIQSENVLACAKHFPGHGDTDADSHLTLPTIPFTAERLDSIELYPYKKLFDVGLASVMTAHLSVPSFEPNESLPSSLSKNIITGLLKERLGFEGLIMTDALNMKGAADFSSSADINMAAFLAGNDLLLIPEDIPATVIKMKKAITDGELSEERLEESLRKILKAKYWAGLRNYNPIKVENLEPDLNNLEAKILHHKLVENSITLVKNERGVFPIKDLAETKIAYIKLGDADNNTFIERLNDYAQVDVISGKKLDEIIKRLKPYSQVIIGYHKSNANPWKDFKFANKELVWLQEIARKKHVILDIFASPYSLLDIKTFTNIEGLVVSYQNSQMSQDISAQMIFGALSTKGKLPVSINNYFAQGTGLKSTDLKRLSYGYPEEVGMSSELLQRVDSIANVVIDSAMAPGLQVLIARSGKVIYRKSFGYHTDKKVRKVKDTDLYDLASVTKILGGLPLIMKLEEEGKLTLDSQLGDLMPVLKNSDKDSITLRDALSHYGRFVPWIPYFKFTVDSVTQKPMGKYYRARGSRKFPVEVAKNFYLRSDYKDSIYQMIADSPLREKREYKYSGLIFYLIKEYLEKTYKKPMDITNDQYFYKPLGAKTLTYKPLEKFLKNSIIPTERDKYYRNQLLHGYVHDQGAAMLGGVNGNAGLFSSSNDVAKMMQMYMQEGYYGGKRFLKRETIQKFNHRYYEKDSVRRGLGFDKPQIDPEIKATCGCVSSESFGHSGYTGTYTWADPETQLVYVFLSNRVYPTAENDKLIEHDIRTKTQQLIQDAIIEE
ncbi:MAG: glycoside hydrolase family 3 N-terminal domain-containing protein [Aureibaculum sp.]|nr:glycoside hydrolase family 3 N-terminal domain-containing protein [Aureibaculum sp.]